MKIRTQFILLITGIIIVPTIVMGIMLLAEYYRAPERTLVPGYKEVSTISGTEIDQKSWDRVANFISRKPHGIDYIIVDQNSVVLYSSLAEIPQASILSDSVLCTIIKTTGQRYLYQFDTPSRNNEGTLFVITRILRERHRRQNPMAEMFVTIVIILIILLAFSASMSVIIARSITKSVMILEESTRKIAAGELDVAIDAKGSNEITSLTLSLNRMRLALKDEQNRRSRFIMGVSHDLKTPLALIKGYTEAISDGLADDPEMMKKSLEIVGSKVNQLEGMIDDLIGFVKLDTGEWRRSLQEHAIAPILRAFMKRITEDGRLLNKQVSGLIMLDDSITVPIDERLFLRAMENIVNNAFRYTPEDGNISVSAIAEPTDSILISVRDNGQGIPVEEIPHIFDLFYRGTNSRREEGMGLGLAVVKSVADSHGWDIQVTSENNEGTCFTIVIPYKPGANTADV